MNRRSIASRHRLPLPVLLVASLVAFTGSCTDGVDPAAPGSAAELTIRPVFLSAMADDDPRTINLVVVTVRGAADGAVLGAHQQRNLPATGTWDFPVEFSITGGPTAVRARVELVHETGTQRVVEWSGESAVITVRGGESSEASVPVGRGPVTNIGVTGLTLPAPGTETWEGDTVRLTPAVAGATGAQVYWRSLTPEIAAVSATGLVTALQPGAARIVARAGLPADTLELAVRPRPSIIRVTPAVLRLESLGSELEVSAEAVDARGAVITGLAVTWSISDTTIVRRAGNRIQARRNGTTTVTFRTAGERALVLPVPAQVEQRVAQVRLLAADTLRFNRLQASVQLTAEALDAGGSMVPNAVLSWVSVVPNVLVVDQTGRATAVGNGGTRIIVGAGNVSANTTVLVRQIPASVRLPADTLPVPLGRPVQIPVLAVDSGGIPIPPQWLGWHIGHSSIATVSTNGTVTGRYPGLTPLVVGVPGAALDTAGVAVTTDECDPTATAGVGRFVLTARAGLVRNPPASDGYAGVPVVFAGGVMYGTSPGTMVVGYNPDNARSDLRGSGVCVLQSQPNFHAVTAFGAADSISGPDGVVIVQDILAHSNAADDDYVLLRLNITNYSKSALNGLHVGSLYDLDMMFDGRATDVAQWNPALQAMEVLEADSVAFPRMVGLIAAGAPLVAHSIHRNPAHITRSGWFEYLSGQNGSHAKEGPTDVRTLIGMGPISLQPGQSRVVWFALVGGDNRAHFQANVAAARARIQATGGGPIR
jgi:hypothetical protein